MEVAYTMTPSSKSSSYVTVASNYSRDTNTTTSGMGVTFVEHDVNSSSSS